MDMEDWKKSLTVLAIIGALIAIGRALAQDEPPKLRIILGRVLIASPLAMAAGAVLLVYPDAPQLAVMGWAARWACWASRPWSPSWPGSPHGGLHELRHRIRPPPRDGEGEATSTSR